MSLELRFNGEKKVRNSRFSFSIFSFARQYLYHSLFMAITELDSFQKEIYNRLCKGECKVNELIFTEESKKAFERLARKGLIIASDVDEPDVLRDIFRNSLGTDFALMYLLVTDSCNLRCKYCFIETTLPKDHKFSLMTEETAKEGIDLFIRNLTTNDNIKRNICIYGGEPLINREVVHKSIEYIRQSYSDKNLNIQLITNGTLISPETAKILAENRVDIAVSFL